MALIKGKQIAQNTITGGATGNIALSTVTYQNVDASIMTKTALGNTEWDAQNRQIKNLSPGTLGTDAVNLNQLNAVVAGISWKEPVRAATIAALPNAPVTSALTAAGSATITATGPATPLVIDGVSLATNDRLLVKNESGGLGAQFNGIYRVVDDGTGANPWQIIRSDDANTAAGNTPAGDKVKAGMAVIVTDNAGSNADTVWLLTTDNPITLAGPAGTNLTFALYPTAITPYTAGDGIDISLGNVISVDLVANANGVAATAQGALKFVGVSPNGELSIQLAAITGGLGAAASGGLQTFAAPGNGLSVFLAATVNDSGATAANARGGILVDTAGGTPGGLSVALANSGGLEMTGGLLSVSGPGVGATKRTDYTNSNGTSASFARADHWHAAPRAVTADKDLTASVSTGAGTQVGPAITYTPAFGVDPNLGTQAQAGYVRVFINGVSYKLNVAAADASKDLYFSGDGGVTARAANAVQAGDILYQGASLGFNTDATDDIDYDYAAFY